MRHDRGEIRRGKNKRSGLTATKRPPGFSYTGMTERHNMEDRRWNSGTAVADDDIDVVGYGCMDSALPPSNLLDFKIDR